MWAWPQPAMRRTWYHAAWDAMPRRIPCRVRHHVAWDAVPGNLYLTDHAAGQPCALCTVARRSADSAALLVFSGGKTRAAAGPLSEGLSYWKAADAQHWFGHEAVSGREWERRVWVRACGRAGGRAGARAEGVGGCVRACVWAGRRAGGGWGQG